MMVCKECLDIHLQNPKNESHRVIKMLDNGNLEKTENDFCVDHKERLKYYCFDDKKPLCIVCARFEDHKSHTVLRIEDIFEEG
jgi:hypothetical protein